jgi:hypothetical protein
MEALFNPFRANLHAMGDRMLQSHRAVTDWQLSQVKLAEKHVSDWMAFQHAALDASAHAAHGMTKTLLDAVAPSTDKSA